MRINYTFLLLFFSFSISCQVIFEPVPPVSNFNIRDIIKSSDGKYFVNSTTDATSFFTSNDLKKWDRIQGEDFLSPNLGCVETFSDGTKVIGKSPNRLSYIQRGKIWERFSDSNASTIVNDTLFTYRRGKIEYSVDKGQSFQIFQTLDLITKSMTSDVHVRSLWILDKYICLRQANSLTHFSVFNKSNGERIYSEELEGGILYTVHNPICNNFYFFGPKNYYKVNIDNFTMAKMPINTIILNASKPEIFYTQGDLFVHTADKIYKSSNCNLDWKLWKENTDWIDKKLKIYDNKLMIAFEKGGDEFTEYYFANNTYNKHKVDIDFPHVQFVDQTKAGYQICKTDGIYYTKKITDEDWGPLGKPSPKGDYKIEYTHTGKIIANDGFKYYYSLDNGKSYENMALPKFSGHIKNVISFKENFLFISYYNSGNFAYSLDDGQTWEDYKIDRFELPYSGQNIQLVGDYIYMLSITDKTEFSITRHNLKTKLNETKLIGIFEAWKYKYMISKTGIFYIQTQGNISGFSSWTFDGTLIKHDKTLSFDFIKYLWQSNEAYDFFIMYSSYFTAWNGEKFQKINYEGIPKDVSRSSSSVIPIYYYYSKDGYVFGVRDHKSSIYRTTSTFDGKEIIKTKPSHKNSTKKKEYFRISDIQNTDVLQFEIKPPKADKLRYQIYDDTSELLMEGEFALPIYIDKLVKGSYLFVLLNDKGLVYPRSFKKK